MTVKSTRFLRNQVWMFKTQEYLCIYGPWMCVHIDLWDSLVIQIYKGLYVANLNNPDLDNIRNWNNSSWYVGAWCYQREFVLIRDDSRTSEGQFDNNQGVVWGPGWHPAGGTISVRSAAPVLVYWA